MALIIYCLDYMHLSGMCVVFSAVLPAQSCWTEAQYLLPSDCESDGWLQITVFVPLDKYLGTSSYTNIVGSIRAVL